MENMSLLKKVKFGLGYLAIILFYVVCAILVGLNMGTMNGQIPIGLSGPNGGRIDYFDWFNGTPSGCTTSGAKICVGAIPRGDTSYYTGFPANASGLPDPSGLAVIGTINDFNTNNFAGNLMLFQFAKWDWAAPNTSYIMEINGMQGFGTTGADTNTPAGWFGHCTNGDDGSGNGCTWKSRGVIVFNDSGTEYLLYPVERQVPAGNINPPHDVTFLISPDYGIHWCNPYTWANRSGSPGCDSSNWQANGDPPTCGAINGTAGSNCLDASYTDVSHSSIMYKGTTLWQWAPVIYGVSGSLPTVNDWCDPSTYLCFMGQVEGTMMRVAKTANAVMDVSQHHYYTCSTQTAGVYCPTGDTTAFANRTPVFPTWTWNITYLPEFKSYLVTGEQGWFSRQNILSAAPISGEGASNNLQQWGFVGIPNMTFADLSRPLGYTVVGSNPPHLQLTMVSDILDHSVQRTFVLSKWDLYTGKIVQGPQPVFYNYGTFTTFGGGTYDRLLGLSFTDSHSPYTIPRKGATRAFDFSDYRGQTENSGDGGYQDLLPVNINTSSWMNPTFSGTNGFNSGQGVISNATGAQIDGSLGYTVNFSLYNSSLPTTVSGSKAYTSVPEMAGNSSYSVGVLFKANGTGFETVPIWYLGQPTTTDQNGNISLGYDNTTGGPLRLTWGLSPFNAYYGFTSGFTPTIGNWYYIVCTVTANGASPIGHMYVGVGGKLVDEIAGVSRTISGSGGTPLPTPNVIGFPLLLGQDIYQSTVSIQGSYGWFQIWNRPISYNEASLGYQTIKKVMLKTRGITVQ